MSVGVEGNVSRGSSLYAREHCCGAQRCKKFLVQTYRCARRGLKVIEKTINAPVFVLYCMCYCGKFAPMETSGEKKQQDCRSVF